MAARGEQLRWALARAQAYGKCGAAEQDSCPADERLCPDCRSPMEVRELELVCRDCGRLGEECLTAEPSVREAASLAGVRSAPRFRITGPDSGAHQSVLDRASVAADPAEARRRQVARELADYNRAYVAGGGWAFPHNVLERAAEDFAHIRQRTGHTKRDQEKKRTLAALVYHRCHEMCDYARSKREAASLLQLEHNSIATGNSYLQNLHSEGVLGLDINDWESKLVSYVRTALSLLGYSPESRPMGGHAGLEARRAAARDRFVRAAQAVVRAVRANHIPVSSELRSQAYAAVYEVLRRGGENVTLDLVVQKCSIRKNTLNEFLEKLRTYHSRFRDVYAAHNLSTKRVRVSGGRPST